MPDPTLLDEIGHWIDDVWSPGGDDERRVYSGGRWLVDPADDASSGALTEGLRRLDARLPADELCSRAAALYFDPLAWQQGPAFDDRTTATLANQQAAAQAGLANLAQLAGYPDAVRLEWAMEARLGDGVGSAPAVRRAPPDMKSQQARLRATLERCMVSEEVLLGDGDADLRLAPAHRP